MFLLLLLLIQAQIQYLTASNQTYCNNLSEYNDAREKVLRYPNHNWSLSEWGRVRDQCDFVTNSNVATLIEPKNGSRVLPNTRISISLQVSKNSDDMYICCHDEGYKSTECFRGREGGFRVGSKRGLIPLHIEIYDNLRGMMIGEPMIVYVDVREHENYTETLKEESIVSLSPSLKILTIVLNGMPFIQRHLPTFEQLSPEIDWEWHVVEGVALGRADSSRPYSTRSIEDSHREYRSKDGTSEYLDYVESLPNSRVVLYRKPQGQAWKDKLEMINTVVHNFTRPGLLIQIDSDEIWNVGMIRNAIEIFHHNPNRKCAYFHSHFFVTPSLTTSTVDGYGHQNRYEWLRMWRFEPGMHFISHAPPTLVERRASSWNVLNNIKQDGTNTIIPTNSKSRPCFTHGETAAEGIAFTHFAYVNLEQVKFKSKFYGHSDTATESWINLVRNTNSTTTVRLNKYLPWISDDTVATSISIINQLTLPWSKIPPASLHDESFPLTSKTIVFDGAIFQLQNQHLGGISRVWSELFPPLVRKCFYS